MALQWVMLGAVTASEALLVLLVTLPLPKRLRLHAYRLVASLVQPLSAFIPFAIFNLLDIYWKYQKVAKCSSDVCTAYERHHYEKFIFKAQRNVMLGLGALLFYWMLYRLAQFQNEMRQLEERLSSLKKE